MTQLSYLWYNYLNSVYLSVANMDGITFCVMRGGSLVDFTNFVRRDVGSNLNIASLIERFNQCARQLLNPHLEYYMVKPVQMKLLDNAPVKYLISFSLCSQLAQGVRLCADQMKIHRPHGRTCLFGLCKGCWYVLVCVRSRAHVMS